MKLYTNFNNDPIAKNEIENAWQEAKKEAKEKDGKPEVKQRIKNIQREMANKRMISDVPKADVIVTNPTHISIALKYAADEMVSPEVIAKGADNLALKIREVAKENNIPPIRPSYVLFGLILIN